MWASKGYRAKIHIPDWKIWQIDEAVNQTSYALLVLWITIMKWTWICHVDKKIFFSNLTIIINQVWLHQKVQTTKEMRNLANYKFTVCWACMAVIKSVCKIVWRAASVLFVFQWYYNRRPPGAQPTFSLKPQPQNDSGLFCWILGQNRDPHSTQTKNFAPLVGLIENVHDVLCNCDSSAICSYPNLTYASS